MDPIIMKNHDKTKKAFYFLLKTACLKVNVSFAKINILFDGATNMDPITRKNHDRAKTAF